MALTKTGPVRKQPRKPPKPLTRQRGPWALLTLAVIEQAVIDITQFIRGANSGRKLSVRQYNELLEGAQGGDLWLRGQTDSELTFAYVCQFHELDIENTRARIYRQWKPDDIEHLRTSVARVAKHV
jgi:hypothetical protein